MKTKGGNPLEGAGLETLARILESFAATLDFDEVMRRVVRIALEEFAADRAWILGPVDEPLEFAEIACEATSPEWPGAMARSEKIPLASSRPFLRRVLEADGPVEGWPGAEGLDADMLRQYGARSQLVQILTTSDGRSWAFGLHACAAPRSWSDAEKRLFATVGRYAKLAIDNAILHRKAIAEAAALEAILDQIPEAAAIYGADGVLTTEGHRAAEDLARREVDARARLEAVLETAPVGIAVVSADELRFEIANREWIEFAGRYGRITDGTEMIGLRVGDIIPHLEPVLSEAAEKNQSVVDEAIPIRSGGHVFFYDRIISPVRGRLSGIPQSLTILVQNVTESVRSKQEIEALVRMMEDRTARLDSILGSMTDALWVFDADGAVVDVNRAALSMFGLASQSDAIARSSFADFHLRYPDHRPIAAADLPFARALRGEIVPDFVAVGSHLITSRDIDLSVAAAPIRSGGAVVGAVIVIRDISALQELDRKKDEFLSVASHELRTPLTTIRGYTQLLLQLLYEIDPEERTAYLQSMLGEIDRMMGLISELLDVSRIQRNRLQVSPQDLDWVEFVRTLTAATALQHPERTVEFTSDIERVSIKADPQRMRQVIDNLMSNALKYSPEESPVTVRVDASNGTLFTYVEDRGIGIPADELPRLFERFHRARNVSSRYYGGLGLGLYISRAIIESHGGRISVETLEGSGSVFRIDLPLPSNR